MEFDADASLRIAAIEVPLGDGDDWYRIPALSALDWLTVLQGGAAWTDIVPGMLEPSERLDQQVMAGAYTIDQLNAAARDALTAAAGVRWQVASQLIALSARHELAGPLILRAVDPARLSLGGFLVACYALATEAMTPAKRAEFDMLLNAPPPGARPEEWFDEDEAADTFMNAFSAFGPS